jgi:hypothetical protein
MRRFIKRKNIKFRKRKCGKEQTAEECVADFEKFLTYVLSVLPPREEDVVKGCEKIMYIILVRLECIALLIL